MQEFRHPKRLAVIGFGAISEELVRCLETRGELNTLAGVLVRPLRVTQVRKLAAGRFAVVEEIDALLNLGAEVVVECAGHGALRCFGPPVLARGIDLIISSVGALADPEFAAKIASAAENNAQVWIPSGAVAGIDGLLAARTAGLKRVTYTSVKPPLAWNGTPAEGLLTGAAREQRRVFFEGSARDAAIHYPQNANVGATIAFAGLGLDCTQVRLVSDPGATGPLGIIEADGDFGTFRFEVLAYASPINPKTSVITAHSMLAGLREGMCFPVLPMLATAH